MKYKKENIKNFIISNVVAKVFYRPYVWYLYNTRRGHNKLKHNLMTRKENTIPKCLDCGLCCHYCIAFNYGNNKCKIWKHNKMLKCRDFPTSKWDLYFNHLKNKCRYYW